MTFATLAELATAARTCHACSLCKERTQVVPGEGSEQPEILFIGEGPGFREDKQGRPFIGAAGQLLDEMIGLIGLKRPQVFITNVVKCRPPSNRDPLPEEIAACKPWLDQQMELLKPKLIVTLGRHAMGIFLQGESITKIHGMPKRTGKHMVMPMYHPAAALYQQSLKKTLEADFLKIPDLLKTITKPVADPTANSAPSATTEQTTTAQHVLSKQIG